MTVHIIQTRHGKMAIHYPQDFISQALLTKGEYEWYVIELVIKQAQLRGPGVILDIGSNMGTVCLPVAQQLPDYTVAAFEPLPAMQEILLQNIQLNNITNIQTYNHALGDSYGVMQIQEPLYDQAANIGAFSLNPAVWENSDISIGHGKEIAIEIKPLDSMIFYDPICCIKLDVEGYELSVLKGAVETLRVHDFPPIIYERWSYNAWWNNEAKLLQDWLAELGYQVQHFSDTAIAEYKQ
jgi:FkbM family methyltransferase